MTGRKLQRFKPRDKKRTPFSASTMNEIVDLLNALQSMQIARGQTDEIVYSEHNIVIQLSADTPGGGGGVNYKGEYDSEASYAVGDIVRVSPANDSAAPSGTVIPGVYICTLADPGDANKPIYPLQAAESPYWNWLSTWPSAVNVCDASTGLTLTDWVDSQPKPSS